MSNDKEKGQRRVYVLPHDLVERIVEYQNEMGIASEVEAARRLLDEALMRRDDWRSIAKRFKERLTETRVLTDIAKDVLIGHPLVSKVAFKTNSVEFSLSTDENVEINKSGEVTAQDEHGRYMEYEPKSKMRVTGSSFAVDMDDEPPF